MVCLKLFAGASLETDGRPLTGPAVHRHRLALLAVLAAAHPAAVPRDKLTAYLWPERDAEHARNLLSQAVYVLRKTLGEDVILAAGDDLRFNANVVACDVVGFQRAIAMGDLSRAVELYTGCFLDGFFLAASPELERWVERERARLAGEYARALELLAELAQREGDPGRAVEWWKARAAHDPYDSRVALRLMQVLESSGNPAGALQHAATHERLLRQELDLEPSPEVRAAMEVLRARRETRDTTNGARSVPVGDDPVSAERPDDAGVEHQHQAPGRVVDDGPRWNGIGGYRRGAPSLPLAVTVILILAVTISLGSAKLTNRSAPERSPTTAGGEASHATAARSAPVRSSRKIAVLPFTNLSGDREDDYFSDGLTEELTTALSGVRALRVVARTSAFAFKDENRDIRAIGQALDVGTLLEGSVRREGGRVRVTAQLIDAADGFHVWAETYERQGTDLLAIQLDPSYATAHHWYGNFLTAAGRFDEALVHKRKAVDLDPLAPVLSESLGHTLARAGHFAAAFEAYRGAIELDSTFWRAHTSLGALYETLGRLDEAESAYRRAIALAGTDANVRTGLVRILARTGRQDEARGMLAELREEANRVGIHQPGVATAFLAIGDDDGAIAWLEQSFRERVPQIRVIGGPAFERLESDPRYVGLLRRVGLRDR